VHAEALREQVARDGALVFEAVGSSMTPTVPGGGVLRVGPLLDRPRSMSGSRYPSAARCCTATAW